MNTDYHSSYANQEDILVLIHQFENCTLKRSQWNHQAHLTVAIWYLLQYPEAEAIELIREGIKRYNRANSIASTLTGGYHETITRFWITITQQFLANISRNDSKLEIINRFIKEYREQKKLFLEFYTPEKIYSDRARLGLVRPDLVALIP